jgi:hypothetical protein
MIKQSFPRSPDRIAAVIAGACLAVGVVGTKFMAFGQDQSVASPQEVMFARKTLMSAIAYNMQEIEGMTSSGKIDSYGKSRERGFDLGDVDGLSASFPPTTNQWRPQRSAGPTLRGPNAPRDRRN